MKLTYNVFIEALGGERIINDVYTSATTAEKRARQLATEYSEYTVHNAETPLYRLYVSFRNVHTHDQGYLNPTGYAITGVDWLDYLN